MPNGIANPIQETSGTNGGSMFYRYCSRRSTDVRLESVIRILRVLSTVCKRIYGLAFVYRRPCYHFPRPLTFFLSGRSADGERGIKIGDPKKNDRDSIYRTCCDSSPRVFHFFALSLSLSLIKWRMLFFIWKDKHRGWIICFLNFSCKLSLRMYHLLHIYLFIIYSNKIL